MSPVRVDLLILAGGRGERLGGQDKAALEVGGRTLLDRVLEGAEQLGGSVVVVGDTPVPDGVARTLEDPPDGGPVAGIAAGLVALDAAGAGDGRGAAGGDARPAAWVAVIAVDQPGAAQALAVLRTALPGVSPSVDVISHEDDGGHRQWLLALYRRPALEAAIGRLESPRGMSVRRLVADLRWHVVESGTEHVGDVDTWEDASRWEGRLGSQPR